LRVAPTPSSGAMPLPKSVTISPREMETAKKLAALVSAAIKPPTHSCRPSQRHER
jgi:hypothetical protein